MEMEGCHPESSINMKKKQRIGLKKISAGPEVSWHSC
jgi:hypothetical protein